jgi:hypothetical protein
MTNPRERLEALERRLREFISDEWADELAAIRAALEQPEPVQVPVAWLKHGPYDDDEPVVCVYQNPHNDDFYTPLYAAPQPAQASVPEGWVPVPVEAPMPALLKEFAD